MTGVPNAGAGLAARRAAAPAAGAAAVGGARCAGRQGGGARHPGQPQQPGEVHHDCGAGLEPRIGNSPDRPTTETPDTPAQVEPVPLTSTAGKLC